MQWPSKGKKDMSKISDKRSHIHITEIELVLRGVYSKIVHQPEIKGCGTWQSTDEIRGVVQREIHELDEAIHKKNIDEIRSELMDIAVACVFGISCIDAKKVDW